MNKILWHNRARKQLLKIEFKKRMAIIENVEKLIDFPASFPSNVKKLKNHQHDYRMRIGQYRVLFDYKETVKIISIEEVKKRNERTY